MVVIVAMSRPSVLEKDPNERKNANKRGSFQKRYGAHNRLVGTFSLTEIS